MSVAAVVEENTLTTYFLPPLNTREDESQEIELARLLGIKRVRRPSGISYSRELSYGSGAPDWSTPLIPLDSPSIDEGAIERVLQWMVEQPGDLQMAVINYLDDPDPLNLEKVTKLLKKYSPIPEPTTNRNPTTTEEARGGTLTALLIRTMQTQPCTMEAMYSIARKEHQAKRPEAAVRQFIRRMIGQGRVTLTNGLYSFHGKAGEEIG